VLIYRYDVGRPHLKKQTDQIVDFFLFKKLASTFVRYGSIPPLIMQQAKGYSFKRQAHSFRRDLRHAAASFFDEIKKTSSSVSQISPETMSLPLKHYNLIQASAMLQKNLSLEKYVVKMLLYYKLRQHSPNSPFFPIISV
jgi:hypothetical protein